MGEGWGEEGRARKNSGIMTIFYSSITNIKSTHHLYFKNPSFLWMFSVEGRKEKQSPTQHQFPSWVSLFLGLQPTGLSLSRIHTFTVNNALNQTTEWGVAKPAIALQSNLPSMCHKPIPLCLFIIFSLN